MNLLRRARFFSGVTLQVLSKKSGVSVSRLSNYERGFAELSQREKKKISRILRTDIAEIFPQDQPSSRPAASGRPLPDAPALSYSEKKA